MRCSRAVSLLGCAFLGAACTTSKLAADDPHDPPVSQALPAAQPELLLDTDVDGAAPLALGARCDAEKDRVHCGTQGRVSVVITMNNGFAQTRPEAPPCRYVELDPDHMDMYAGRGCVEGGRVYLTAVCVMCRQATEWSLVGLIAEMNDGQLTRAQRQVGIAERPVLRTNDDWRTALATTAAMKRRRR
jgi:hypothetical protein